MLQCLVLELHPRAALPVESCEGSGSSLEPGLPLPQGCWAGANQRFCCVLATQ